VRETSMSSVELHNLRQSLLTEAQTHQAWDTIMSSCVSLQKDELPGEENVSEKMACIEVMI